MKEKNLICMICGMTFNTFKQLSYHIKTHKITTKEYYDKYLKKENEGICPVCGNSTKFKSISIGYFNHCSRSCINLDIKVRNKIKETNLEKYGVENPFQSEKIKNKIKETKKEQYGNEYYNNREKAINTNFEKFGTKTPAQNPLVLKKMQDTCIKKYGVKNGHNDEINENIKKDCLEKYGVEFHFQRQDVQDKIKKTLQNKYGVDNPFESKEIQDKIIHTNIKKYGVKRPAQNREIQKKSLSHYKYNNLNFDSSWELATYIYCIDNNIPIIRLPIRFEYYDKNNKKHYYFPDFLINDKLIEIKGPQYLDDNG